MFGWEGEHEEEESIDLTLGERGGGGPGWGDVGAGADGFADEFATAGRGWLELEWGEPELWEVCCCGVEFGRGWGVVAAEESGAVGGESEVEGCVGDGGGGAGMGVPLGPGAC